MLSGLAAAYAYGLIKGSARPPEVSTLTYRRVRGVLTHRVRELPRREVTVYRGIPITTVPRTVVDIAPALSFDDLAEACHEAQVRYRLKAPAVEAVLARKRNTPGAADLHEIFRGQARITLSDLERTFLRLLRAAGLPLPDTSRSAGGRYVDCRWPEQCLTVELDSYRYHHTRHAWEQDRRRERQARARGDEFRRYTYNDIAEDTNLALAELRELLG